MTVSPTRPPSSPAAIPSPRSAEPELPSAPGAPTEGGRERPPARYPWPEPWRPEGRTRPPTEYWDVVTASWRTGSTVHRSED